MLSIVPGREFSDLEPSGERLEHTYSERFVGLTHGGIEILTVTTHMCEKLAGLLKPDCQSTGRTAKMEK